MIQNRFAEHAAEVVSKDSSVIGMAVGGSWLTNEMDEFSDLDLIIITTEKISHDQKLMISFASRFGKLLSAFTGEHVGEPRVLICLFDDPLLHVDIKFLVKEEFAERIETPVLLVDKNDVLKNILAQSTHKFPYPDYQWIEDRFWTWIHYGLLKIGRGEYMEAHDFLAFLRMVVFGPLLHIKNGNLPRGVRKVEFLLTPGDQEILKRTLAGYDRESLIRAIAESVAAYLQLANELYPEEILRNSAACERVSAYLNHIRNLT